MKDVKKLYQNSTGRTRPSNSTNSTDARNPHSRQFIYNKAAARAAKINQQTGGTEWQNR
jgi:hypothetical protein|tara:strand:- start:1776 stop:1952 length:177 start_codon:yes stop_codon:yes gene_type:complete